MALETETTQTRRGPRRFTPPVALGELFDKLPPHSVEMEAALLGAMILDPKVIGEVVLKVRSGDDFYKPAHGAIYSALVELYDKHDAGDLALLHEMLEKRGVLGDVGGPEFLVELAESVPAAVNAPYYAGVVAEKALVRRLIGAAGEILRSAYMDEGDVRAVLDAAQKLVFDVVLEHHSDDAQSLASLLEETLKSIESREKGHITGLRSHFKDLDEMTSGLQNGELIILAARPSMGKTALALNIAEHIAVVDSVPVGVFSLEMGRQQLAERLLCSRSEVDSHRLRRNMINRNDYHKIATAVGELSEAPIYIDDTPGLGVLELRAKARRMVLKHEVKLIVVDYLQLMMGPDRESRQQEVSEISRGVKALARELRIPIICLSQLNRAAENREDHRPRMADLRESGSIEQDADVVMMLHREDYYNQVKEDFVPSNVAELILAKQRNGPTGTVRMTWVGSSMKFKDFAEFPPTVEFNPSGQRSLAGVPGHGSRGREAAPSGDSEEPAPF